MKKIIFLLLISYSIQSCGVYSFTGGSVGEAKTISVPFFPNNAPFVEPSLSQKFTYALQDKFLQQTNLSLSKGSADVTFEGEISQYRITPIAATANNTASQSRLTIGIKVRFYNKIKEEDNFEKTFTHFFDYGADEQLVGSTLETAYEEIFERITQDIFNEAFAKW